MELAMAFVAGYVLGKWVREPVRPARPVKTGMTIPQVLRHGGGRWKGKAS